MKKAKRKVRA